MTCNRLMSSRLTRGFARVQLEYVTGVADAVSPRALPRGSGRRWQPGGIVVAQHRVVGPNPNFTEHSVSQTIGRGVSVKITSVSGSGSVT